MRSKDDFINQHIFDTEYHINLVDADKAKDAMDEYAKEMCLELLCNLNDRGYCFYDEKQDFDALSLFNQFIQETNKSE